MIDNALSEYMFALGKDCPGKTWWDADFTNRAPIYRSLRIDSVDEGAAYAIAPFRLARVEDRWLILAAHPAPDIFEPTPDWLDIEIVIAWDPNTDTAHVLADPSPQLAGSLRDDANQIFASPRAFFQAWAVRRAQFAVTRTTAQDKHWHVTPAERDEVPGALLIGEHARLKLSPSALPANIECVGVDPKDINRAIMRAARLPRVTSAPSSLRRAA